jgi:hypothetical protein
MPVTAPTFVFDSREQWKPCGVEESLSIFGIEWPFQGDRLNFPNDMDPVAIGRLHPVVYTRTLPDGPLVWEQFWLWYTYNPWNVGGVGKHEGDWEFVQIGYSDFRTPILMTCSQHHTGGKREYWTVELENESPVVYVARGSHANYFAAGSQGGGLDRCDGKGLVLRPDDYELRRFGPWAMWPGRWGNSTGEGQSPQSPGRQGHRWKAPHLFHSSAR